MREGVLVLVVALGGCAPDHAGPDDAGPGALQFLAVLDDASDLDAIHGENGDIKFLAQVEGAAVTPPVLEACEFENTGLYPFHELFLNAQPGGEDLTYPEYVARVIKRATRVWWGGDVAFLPSTPHPITGAPGVLAWNVYSEDSDGNRLLLDDVRAAFARLAPCMPAFAGKLAFVPNTSEQTATVRDGQAELAGEDLAVLLP